MAASCDDDDDFTILQHQNHSNPNHHQTFNPKKLAGDDEEEAEDDDYTDAGFHDVVPFTNNASNTFITSDLDKSRSNFRIQKRKVGDREEISDYSFKKTRSVNGGSVVGIGIPVVGYYRVDSRKDREEWSDSAIGVLLDAYTDKFLQLNRGNLRGRDWEEVAAIVSERCCGEKTKGGKKSVEQCKNKVDNLKKRYKVELQRMISSGVSVSSWIWFKSIEGIIGNLATSSTSKRVSEEDEEKSPGSEGNMVIKQQVKRYPVATPSSIGMGNNIVKQKSLPNPRWRRVIFRISGAALLGSGPQRVDPKVTMMVAREVTMACRIGVEVAIVVGGRNFFCGKSWVDDTGLDRSTAYHIGMMATVMNSILLQSALEKLGVQARVQTAFPMQEVTEPYNKRRAIRHLEKGRVVIFGGIGAGTGNPLFTSDTAAALRASEINANVVLKGTQVDGVYDCHPGNGNKGVAFEHISYRDLQSRGLADMDMMAMSICEKNGIPVVVFNLLEPGNISRALCGDQVGTLIDQGGRIS